MKKSYLTVTDQFCGAGGSSIGATAAGAELRLALNHWQLAIETHNSNFPNALHDCTDISACDPRRYPSTDILITSPECFPAGTLILAARGLTPIESVQVGDLVLTHNGRWRGVTNVMCTERETMFVCGQGHRKLEVSGEHPFYVREQTKQWNDAKRDYDRRVLRETEWVNAIDLLSKTYRWASPSFVPAMHIPPVIGANARRVEFSTEFWWMVGRWLGDGIVRLRDDASSEVSICCGKHKVDDMEALHFAPRQGAHAKQEELHWRKREMRTSYIFECTHDSLAYWLAEHFGKGAHGKTIPAWVMGMPLEWREALLSGYVSADGHRNARGTSVSSVSKRLALGIRLLVTTLGYHPTLACYRHRGGTIEGRPFEEYDLWMVRWENNKSQRTGIGDDRHSWTLVKGVIPSGRNTTVYNLSVDEDESYVADGIVVHNCTNHSLAKGKRRHSQPDLFGANVSDPAEERSRATMWDVPRFAEYHRYNAIIVENVVDARHWVTWDAWLHAMQLLGYEHQIVFFNSMFARPTPQSRDRMYVIFWRKGNTAPDLDFHPPAWCAKCQREIASVQSWKRAGQRWGRYGAQYVYRCPTCTSEIKPYYNPAASAIDWSLPAPRIGDRDKPLKEKTIARIRAGLEKYATDFLIDIVHTPRNGDGSMVFPVTNAHRTQLGQITHALVVQTTYDGNRARPVTQPMPTQTARQDMALLVPYYSTGVAKPTSEPVPTVTTTDRHALVVPRHYLVQPGSVPAVEDCGFRMLRPHEIRNAMAFPADYIVLGNGREQVKQYGNAVTPPVMQMLVEKVVKSL